MKKPVRPIRSSFSIEDRLRAQKDIDRLKDEISTLNKEWMELNFRKNQLQWMILDTKRDLRDYNVDETMTDAQVEEKIEWVKRPAWVREPEKYKNLKVGKEWYGEDAAAGIRRLWEYLKKLLANQKQNLKEIKQKHRQIQTKKKAVEAIKRTFGI